MGYHNEGNLCIENVCVCDHGTPHTGKSGHCTNHGAHQCATCPDGFHLSSSGKCHCGPVGSNCYQGVSGGHWFAAGSNWTLERFPRAPDLAFIMKPVDLTQTAPAAAEVVVVDDNGILEISGSGLLELSGMSKAGGVDDDDDYSKE